MNIVDLPKPKTEALRRDEKLIATLTTILEEANAGRVVGLCVCYLDHKNMCTYVHGGAQNYGTIGALQIMQQKIARDCEL